MDDISAPARLVDRVQRWPRRNGAPRRNTERAPPPGFNGISQSYVAGVLEAGESQSSARVPARKGVVSDKRSTNDPTQNIQQLLARTAVIVGPCELDLLLFLYRHPRTLLTNEQLAAFVGYDMKQIAKSIDAFIDAGLLERAQNSLHVARMYLLVIEGEESGGLKTLLRMASTGEGRRDILRVLASGGPNPPTDLARTKGGLRVIA